MLQPSVRRNWARAWLVLRNG
ncbi:UNVERIFIED_CONTAM: hypothetical protein GTU68_062623 [Idotea baltica]|nr:hypothetical protein [Idotea baltica]